MAYPKPEVGLVVSCSYLWSDEAAAGHVESKTPAERLLLSLDLVLYGR